MEDVFVYLVDLPKGINEAVMPCSDGWTIYLDVNLSEEKRRSAYHHAMWHIMNNDWTKGNVQEIEAEAHKRVGNN